MQNNLASKLESAGYAPLTLTDDRGGQLVVLPTGARIIGAFGPSCPDNAIWVSPAVFDRDKFLANPGWKNFGGERTWVSPERELFIKDLRQPGNSYVVPAVFDPGAYRVVTTDRRKIVLENDAQVVSHLSGEKANIRITKEVEILDADHSEADCLTYRQSVTLKLLSSTQSLKLGLWNLTQLPAGGKMLVGTRTKAPFTTYFGQDTRRRVTLGENFISFAVDAKESHKIGIKADFVTSKLGYLRQAQSDQWMFYYRSFPADPKGQYVDTPWNRPEDTGYAVQGYNDGGEYGDFGELEYHSPAIGGNTGKTEYCDTSTINVFTGAKSDVVDKCRLLMNIDPARV